MILTVTLNPTLDKLYIVDDYKKGTVVRVNSAINSAGGKGLNVSRVLNLLGEDVIATGFLGGFTGEYINHLLEPLDIQKSFIKTNCETRSCVNIRDASGNMTEFLESGNEISQKYVDEFFTQYKLLLKDVNIVVISGSVPKGVSDTFYSDLISYAKKDNKKVILDSSNNLLKKNLKSSPTLIKPNIFELGQILGIEISSQNQIIEAAQKIRNMGIETVVVSMGEQGAIIVCDDGIYHGIPPKINALNTVGCGDSMVAGFAYSMSKNLGIEDSIRTSVAVSAANALSYEIGEFKKNDYKTLYSQVKVSKL